jgi:4,5-dihydroxyphthalate decarboxylase
MTSTLAKLSLSCALSDNPRTQPIAEGIVAPEGIELKTITLHPSEMFHRQLKNAEFDVSEMSCSSLTIATSKGQTGWVALPIFTTRRFFHTGVLIRTDRGIKTPKDLEGKRVGVPEFQQTAALWTRAALRSEYGVDARTMHWHMERNPDKSHGGSTGFAPPAGIDLQYVPPEKNLGQMLIDGELDALAHWIDARNLVDRSSVDPRKDPNVRYLFDQDAEAKRYYEKTQIYPINHCVVVRRSIVERDPWVIKSIFDAFEKAKAYSYGIFGQTRDLYVDVGILPRATATSMRTDLLPYGVKQSRKVLETITRSVVEDGLAARQIGLDELFAAETLNL